MTRIYSLISLCLIFLLFSSCKKDPNSILGDDLNNRRNINENYVDSIFQITAFTIPDDSLYIQNFTTFLLGTTYNSTFGTTTYNLVTQLTYNSYLSYLIAEDEKIEQVDSVILTLPYSYSYPLEANSDFLTERIFKLTIYEVNEDIDPTTQPDSGYTIHSEVTYEGKPILEETEIRVHPPQNSSDTTVKHNIRIPLDNALGMRLVQLLEQAIADSNSADFINKFKGLYFKITPATSLEQNIVASFKTDLSSGTNLSVYFNSKASDTARKSACYNFAINTHFTQVIKDRSGSFVESVLWDSIAGKDKLYLESVGGSRIRLNFPNLRVLLNDTTKHVAINRATLVFTVTDTSSNGVLPPSTLHLYKYINNKSISSIIDYGYNSGGAYNATKGEYRLYITRWMQDLLYNKDKEIPYLDLSAVPDIRYMIPTQAILYGSDKVRLEVLYSTIEK